MNKLMLSNTDKTTMTSLELLEQINLFRAEIEGKTELAHRSLLGIIRDEFEEEINAQKLLPVEYADKKGEKRPMFELTFSQAKQVLMRESKSVRKAVTAYIEKLEIALEAALNSPELVMARALKIADEKINALKVRTFVLEAQNETLEIALNDSLRFYTVAKYNKEYKMGWSMKACQAIGKKMSAYCRANSIEIRKCETNDERFGSTNSYPMTAWENFLNIHKAYA